MPLGYFTDSTPLTPLRDPFNVLVDGINAVETAVGDLEDSRALQTFRWADTSERNAQTGMQAGDVGYQLDNDSYYWYSGSAWVSFGLEDTGWATPTLQNGWSSIGSGYVAARYRRLNGIVYVQGTISGGTTTDGTVLFNLPAGFRPSASAQYPVAAGSSSGTMRVEVQSSGNVVLRTPVVSPFSINFSFPAEA